MAASPVFIYRNNNYLISDYIYDDKYLVIFKEENHYVVFEANAEMNFYKSEPSILDDNELSDMVNDTCGGEKVYTLIFSNKKEDPIAYKNFLSTI
jgi:hypothetical protein